jgi:hypothetical protein
MPAPNDTLDLPQGIELILHANGRLEPSPALAALLVEARSHYDWPAGTGPNHSQQTILTLEATVAGLLNNLNTTTAHQIVTMVSHWAGNNASSHANIVCAAEETKEQMLNAITVLDAADGPGGGLDILSKLPGVSLVIATKIYRFCFPLVGVAVDRHASYFFNSLDVAAQNQQRAKATHFLREWANGRHTTTRLRIYDRAGYKGNRKEYINNYFPLLCRIAEALNRLPASYTCAATNQHRRWRAADIEMAAYYWWASHGSR